MSMTGLGIALGTLGSIAINSGNNLQSLGMTQLEARVQAEEMIEEDDKAQEGSRIEPKLKQGEDGEIDACQSKVWVVGTVIFISGSLLNFAAFAFAPQSILASLEGIQFVTNVLFGKLVLGKDITRSMWAGTAVTVCGVALTVLSASVVGTLEADSKHLQSLWGETGWLVYLALTVTMGVALQTTHKVYLKASAADAPLPHADIVLPVTYAMFSALFGTLSVVQAKILSELLTLQFEGTPIFWGPQAWFTYVTLLAWLFTVGVWLFRMNEALSLYDPLFIIPLLQMNFILFAIVSGGIYFKEFDEFGTINWIGFISGVALLFAGIFLLSPRSVVQTNSQEAAADAHDENNRQPEGGTETTAVMAFGSSSARIAPSDVTDEDDVPTTPRCREVATQMTPIASSSTPDPTISSSSSATNTPLRTPRSGGRIRRGNSVGSGIESGLGEGEGDGNRPLSNLTSPDTGTSITSTLPFYNLIPPSMRTRVRGSSMDDSMSNINGAAGSGGGGQGGQGGLPHYVHQATLVEAMRQAALGLRQQVSIVGGSLAASSSSSSQVAPEPPSGGQREGPLPGTATYNVTTQQPTAASAPSPPPGGQQEVVVPQSRVSVSTLSNSSSSSSDSTGESSPSAGDGSGGGPQQSLPHLEQQEQDQQRVERRAEWELATIASGSISGTISPTVGPPAEVVAFPAGILVGPQLSSAAAPVPVDSELVSAARAPTSPAEWHCHIEPELSPAGVTLPVEPEAPI